MRRPTTGSGSDCATCSARRTGASASRVSPTSCPATGPTSARYALWCTARSAPRRIGPAAVFAERKLMGNIVWLASYPKSGNTWLRAFLANLIANRSTPVPLAELPNYGRLEADPELYSQIAGKPSTQMNFDALCALRPQVHAAIAAAAPRTVFVKTHSM